jgi:hypothetical protein
MDVLYPRCAGLDVHQKTVVACARIASAAGPIHRHELRMDYTAQGTLGLAPRKPVQ